MKPPEIDQPTTDKPKQKLTEGTPDQPATASKAEHPTSDQATFIILVNSMNVVCSTEETSFGKDLLCKIFCLYNIKEP